MPLLDHFRPPVSRRCPWESFHAFWIVGLARWLNRTLPKGRFQAMPQLHLGPRVEADVVEFEHLPTNGVAHDAPDGGGVITLAEPTTYTTVATATIPSVFPDVFEIEIIDRTEYDRLVGVIELVSPGNKDRPAEREAFVAKCAAYLQRGIGLTVIDIVTDRRANLHNELVRRLGWEQPPAVMPDEPLYAVGYRPVRRGDNNLIDLWPCALTLGQPLPRVPLPLKGGPVVSLDLDATYTEALTDSGL